MRLPIIELVIITFLFPLLLLSNANFATSETKTPNSNGSMFIQVFSNPGTIENFKILNLDVYIKNNGNKTDSITSINFNLPDGSTYDPKNSQFGEISPGITKHQRFYLKFSDNVVSGTYKLGVIVNTSEGSYAAFSDTTIKGFDVIPLSLNELPLSIFIIVASGILTYVIITRAMSPKTEVNYFGLSFGSVGLGFLNFLILRYYGLMNSNPLALHENPLLSFYIILVGLITGGIGFGIIKVCSWLKSEYEKWKAQKKEEKEKQQKEKEIFKRGYSITGKSDDTWLDFLTTRLTYVKQNIGKYYSISVRVYFRSVPYGRPFQDGIMDLTEERRPIDIVLFPKRILRVYSRNKIVEALTQNPDIVTQVLEEDEIYCRQLAIHLRQSASDKKGITQALISRINVNIANDKNFAKFMEEIDFSRYVVRLASYLYESGKVDRSIEVVMEYDGCPTFIPFETILRVEIKGYETRYAISTKTSNYEEILPAVFPIAETFPLEDKTIDKEVDL